jgi:deazaflavin-dependent oxidoreductase (nitroreductase family)
MARSTRSTPLAVFGDEGWWRNHLHTPRGSRILNTFTTPLWTRFPPRGFGVLTTTGRISGKPRHRSIRVVSAGRTAYVASMAGEEADWVRNLRTDPHVTLRCSGPSGPGVARELHDAERQAVEALYCEHVNRTDYIECFLNVRGWPDRKKIEALHRRWFRTPVAIDLISDS